MRWDRLWNNGVEIYKNDDFQWCVTILPSRTITSDTPTHASWIQKFWAIRRQRLLQPVGTNPEKKNTIQAKKKPYLKSIRALASKFCWFSVLTSITKPASWSSLSAEFPVQNRRLLLTSTISDNHNMIDQVLKVPLAMVQEKGGCACTPQNSLVHPPEEPAPHWPQAKLILANLIQDSAYKLFHLTYYFK